jgi:hypothetical protein
MAASADESLTLEQEGAAHRIAQRAANQRTIASGKAPTDGQGLVELACECMRLDCDRTVKVPVDVYQRMLDADQYLLQAGHHAFPQYRTIITVGLMRIEERA